MINQVILTERPIAKRLNSALDLTNELTIGVLFTKRPKDLLRIFVRLKLDGQQILRSPPARSG